MQNVIIYTDGACKGNPGKGGWAAILKCGDVVKEICGGRTHTTNNEMELVAIMEAIEALKTPCNITLYTDSMLAINWLTGRNKTRKAHIVDLVTYIKNLVNANEHFLRLLHVNGHSGNPMNERVDLLASKTAELQYCANFIAQKGG